MEEETLERLLKSASPSASQKLKKALAAALAEQGSPTLEPEELKSNLVERWNSLQMKHSLKEGQLVRWKPGLRNRTRPGDDEFGIIIDVIDPPIFGKEHESGSPYFREPLDIVVGMLDSDGDFIAFHFDSRRFEPIE